MSVKSLHSLGMHTDINLLQGDSSYIIIKQWVPEDFQELLFEHTRGLRENKRIENVTTEIVREKNKLMLVKARKRSPIRVLGFRAG